MKTCRRCGATKAIDDFHLKRGASDGHQTWCKPCVREAVRQRKTSLGHKPCTCPDCGTVRPVRADKPDGQRCRRCATRLVARSPGAVAARAKRRCTAKVASRRVFVSGCCARCEAPFVLRWWVAAGPVEAKYCSDRCRNWGKGKGRSRPDITPPQRQAVFDRDRWVCRICKRGVSKLLSWPHDRCAVVDHVIPLSAGVENGGVHAMHNWQTAHNKCNRDKADAYLQAALL